MRFKVCRCHAPLIFELAFGSHDASIDRDLPLKCTTGNAWLSNCPAGLTSVTLMSIMMCLMASSEVNGSLGSSEGTSMASALKLYAYKSL
jgi:hypothetical protein